MKTCPFCAEQIQDVAIVCKHCGRDLNVPATAAPRSKPKESLVGWWIAGGAVALVVLVLLVRAWPSGGEVDPSANAVATDALLQAVRTSKQTCNVVTRMFNQGTTPNGTRHWNIACGDGGTYRILIGNDRRYTVDRCDRLAPGQASCFTRLD